MDNYNTYVSLLSRVSPKNPQNTTGLTDSLPTNQNKAAISSLSVNFGRISQNILNFAAQTSLYPAQKISIITASNDRSLNDQKGGRGNA
ncbi:MAG: hypothetical protein IM319_10800 [Microcystis sp. M113S1]|uniref:hypothetical protein n=1 Tax=Microcystis sp. M113S1 TaxID=2771104 RepID=UPI00258D5D2D|nr:hypothetical protein [Microcystis sp. M113S1]MCA2939615.1 hypothetical protein [Microcystis sp. M113S1]